MVRIGIIGLGFGEAVQIPGFQAVSNSNVVGVAAQQKDQVQRVADQYSLPRYYESWEEMIASSEIEAVSVVTPPYFHEEMVLAALSEGKSVLCEKPLAINASQARKMVDSAKENDVVHMVNFWFREIPAWRFAKQLLDAGEIGMVRQVNISWIMHSWASPNRPWSWRSNLSQGGGTLGALGVHTFDYLEWLFGPVKSLTSHLKTSISKRHDDSGILRYVDSDDTCNLLLKLESGASATISISSVAPLGRGHQIEVFGDKKVLIIRNNNIIDYGKGFDIWMGEKGTGELRQCQIPDELNFKHQFQDGRMAPFVSLAQRFIDAVMEKSRENHPSFDDGYRAQLLLDLARQSDSERRWIDVPRIDN